MYMKIKFGVLVPQENETYETIKSVALASEQQGFNSFWFNDHLCISSKPWLDCWVLTASIASITNTIKLGQLVTCNAFRSPALIEKMAASIDVVSNGRLEFGIGAGWHEKEQVAYGYEFDNAVVRIERLREAILFIKKLWTEDKVSMKGKYYTLDDATCNPKPVQKPHPPILIGGCGPKLLKVVAELGDACNFAGPLAPPGTPEDFSSILSKLRE